jgi:electron transfer flavoprotein alpha subunit
MAKKVMVLAEIKDGRLRNVTLESLAAAHQIAQGGAVTAVVIGSDSESFVRELGNYGADHVLVVEHSDLTSYTSEAYTQALAQLISNQNPDAVLFGHTGLGRDLAPRLASKLESGLITDCIHIQETEEGVVFTRPIYSGKAFETRSFRHGLIFVTIRPNNIKPLPINETKTAASSKFEVSIQADQVRTAIKEIVRKASSAVDLSEAKIVVSGGRGVKSEDGFGPLQELADVLGAAVGASRGACDAGYCDYALQIGQTGKVITPELYIACGISGVIQHLAGMSGSRFIIAINKDPEAPIFQVADLGIVGDLFEVVPMLTQEFRQLKKASV